MINLSWSSAFKRAYKRYAKSRPDLKENITKALKLLHENPSHPSLNTHMLRGKQNGIWSCSAGYDCRIIFVYQKNRETKGNEILLLNLGTHDEVY